MKEQPLQYIISKWRTKNRRYNVTIPLDTINQRGYCGLDFQIVSDHGPDRYLQIINYPQHPLTNRPSIFDNDNMEELKLLDYVYRINYQNVNKFSKEEIREKFLNDPRSKRLNLDCLSYFQKDIFYYCPCCENYSPLMKTEVKQCEEMFLKQSQSSTIQKIGEQPKSVPITCQRCHQIIYAVDYIDV
jgi:hypothetical protein